MLQPDARRPPVWQPTAVQTSLAWSQGNVTTTVAKVVADATFGDGTTYVEYGIRFTRSSSETLTWFTPGELAVAAAGGLQAPHGRGGPS